jgi:hypothetical protein
MLMLCKFDVEMFDTRNHFYLELYADEGDDKDGWWLALSPGDATLGQTRGYWYAEQPWEVGGPWVIYIDDSERVSWSTPLRLAGALTHLSDWDAQLARINLGNSGPPLKVGKWSDGFVHSDGGIRNFHCKVIASRWR